MNTDKDNKRLFINFSNHPSSAWGEQQLQAANQLGQVVDLPFTQVDPAMTGEQVQLLARECVNTILEMGAPSDLTVHVMGEMTVIFHVVTALKALGVRCVASTTERMVTEADGKKITEFHFVQFREY